MQMKISLEKPKNREKNTKERTIRKLLSLPPSISIVTDVAPFCARVKLLVGMYFSGTWPIFMIIEPRILFFLIAVTIS